MKPASDLVFGFVNVKNVDSGFEVAQNVVVATHVRCHDAADDVLAQTSKLFDGQSVERVCLGVLQHAERQRAVVVFQRSHIVVAACQLGACADLITSPLSVITHLSVRRPTKS